MDLLVAFVPVCPMRSTASHRAEMVSQLLFGETAELIEAEKDFVKVRALYDGYEGWCQRSQLVSLESGLSNTGKLAAQWNNHAELNGAPLHLPMGTPLDLFASPRLLVNQDTLVYKGEAWEVGKNSFSIAGLEARAFAYLNSPYLWGGRTVWGIDCSGFIQQVYRCFGIPLPRDAWQQAAEGETVGFLQEARCGDLAFFDNPEGKIVHVGMMLANGRIIHASGVVRVDDIDNMGIVNSTTGARTHQLRIIKRYGEVV